MAKRGDIATRIVGVFVRKSQIKKYVSGSSIARSRFAATGDFMRREFSIPTGFTVPPRIDLLAFDNIGEETQYLRCTQGRIFAVFCDLRRGSPTELAWQGVILDGRDAKTLVIPTGVALGWQALEEGDTENASLEYTSPPSRGSVCFSWDDPTLRISWPLKPTAMPQPKNGYVEYASIQESELPIWSSIQQINEQPAKVPSKPEPAKPAQTKPVQQSSVRETTRNRILILGSNGQLGQHLVRSLNDLGIVIGGSSKLEKSSSNLTAHSTFVDVSRPASIRQAIRDYTPSLIVNATSLTNINEAERSPRTAQLINATAPEIIVEEAAKVNASLVHFCSGRVFSGDGHRPWKETDTPRPAGQFARTKFQGTKAILESEIPHLVFRTGWLYSTTGENYLSRTLDALTYRNQISMSASHYGSPTSIDWLASTIAEVLKGKEHPDQLQMWMKEYGGLYHLTASGYTNKLGVADYLHSTASQQGLPVVTRNITDDSQTCSDSSINFRGNERLDSTKFATTFSIPLPRWQDMLQPRIIELAKIPRSQSAA